MLTYLRRLVDERTALTETMSRTMDAAAAEERDLNEAEETAVVGMQTRCAAIDQQLETHNSQAESARRFAGLVGGMETSREPQPPESRRPAQLARTTMGQRFVESEEFRSYTGHGQSGRFPIEGFLEVRAAITTDDLNIPHYQWAPKELEPFRSPLLELCGRVAVSTGVVDWVEIGPDPVAGMVAEGAPKPEATIAMTPRTSALETLAHWVQITRQALEDASYIRSLLETKLRRGLVRKAENDMAVALLGATLPTATGSTAGGDTLLSVIREGIGTVESAGYVPTAIALNPADYAALDVDVMGVTTNGPSRSGGYWGLTPVAVASQPAGTATVGDFASGATFFDRGVTNVFLSDSHASLFISNILVILAEARVKSAITEPGAFCECSVGV
jgi:HK97 family phage major capsid protein